MSLHISVVVINFNRCQELQKTVELILKQHYPNLEVIVVDNASSDGSVAFIEKHFPVVKVLSLNENVAALARRKGVELARGDVVILYDDDSAPQQPDTFLKISQFFVAHPEASALCTHVFRINGDYSETWQWENYAVDQTEDGFFEGLFWHGSGVAVRRKDFLATKAFLDEYFWGDEEFDAALEFVAAGLRIFYSPQIITAHRASLVNRNKKKALRLYTRNHLLTILKHFDSKTILDFSFKEILYQSILSKQYVGYVILGGFDYLKLRKQWKLKRHNVIDRQHPYLKEVNERRYPPFFQWIKNQVALTKYKRLHKKSIAYAQSPASY